MAGMVSTALTALLWLLLAIEWLPFFGDAWHEASIWLNLAIGATALNLGLAFSCLLFLPRSGPAARRARNVARIVALACFWLAMAVVAAAGANDRFLYTMNFSAPIVGLTVCLLVVAVVGAILTWRPPQQGFRLEDQ